MMAQMTTAKARVEWVVANMAGSVVGFVVFAVLAHGLVSPHDEEHPSLAQFGAHALGLFPAGAIIGWAQQLVLRRYVRLSRWFAALISVSMTIAFLFGAYGVRPPFDFLFGYAAVGAVLGFALRSVDARARTNAARVVAMSLLFAVGSFLGMLALSLVAKIFTFNSARLAKASRVIYSRWGSVDCSSEQELVCSVSS